jgi:prepilin-type N-terminal cleavage/methylation domain-containing protein
MKRCYPRPPVGFTLVELLVVIAIIGLLLMILVPTVQTARLQAEVSKTRARVNELAGACDLYHKDTGYYPGQNEPAELRGSTPAGTYSGSQYLAKVLLVHGGAEFTSGDFLDDGPDDDLSTGGTISDRTSKNLPILYYPARLAETALVQFKFADNEAPPGITEAMFWGYIRDPALNPPLGNGTSVVPDSDRPFADGKFIIVAPNHKGEYFTGGPTYPSL